MITNISDPTHSANDLHDVMCGVYDVMNIGDMENEVRQIVRIFTDKEELPDQYIMSNSYDLKTIMFNLASIPAEKPLEWDNAWANIATKYSYDAFCRLGLMHRNTFQDMRKSYLMYSVCSQILDGPPKTFGIMQLLTEKYIEDIIINAPSYTDFEIIYEDFEGNNQKIKVCGGEYSSEDIECRPSAHWVGKTIFDSFYMIPVLEIESRTWNMIPVDLIRSIRNIADRSGFPGSMSGGDADEF
jgi:hypothetical protein